MRKIKIISFIILLVLFCSCNNFNNPTDGFKIEGQIENSEDCLYSNGVVVLLYNPITKISESKYENNFFSLFLPYELSNKLQKKYCSAVGINEYRLYDSKFESYFTISNKDVKICQVEICSVEPEEFGIAFIQFGYTESYYDNQVAYVTLAKTKYIYAQSAVSVKGEYESYVAGTEEDGVLLPKTVKVDLLLQKGWNTIYHVGNFKSLPSTHYWDMDSAIINITTVKPESIELKWYYNSSKLSREIVRNTTQFGYLPYIYSYYSDFIINSY